LLLRLNVDAGITNNLRDDSELRVTGFTRVYNQDEWTFPMHIHNDIADVVLITKGEGTLLYNNQKFKTQKGDLLVFNQDLLHGEHTNPQNPLEEICISLTGVQIDGLPYNHVLPDNIMPIVKTGEFYEVIYHLFHMIEHECTKKESGYDVICRDAAKTMLTIVQQLVDRCEDVYEAKKMNFPVILEVVEYLNVNYNENISLEELARKFHFSSYYLARKFKEETGFTINQYITTRRMGEAEKLLTYTDMSIAEISFEIGYDNINHFYATFKKYTGLAPGKLKERYNRT
jgi:AraC-like DNA-binding protein